MKVFIEKDKKEIDFSFSGSALDLLSQLDVNKETVLVIRNSELITLDEKLVDSDTVKILSVVSGG